jgi:hypothetical protein
VLILPSRGEPASAVAAECSGSDHDHAHVTLPYQAGTRLARAFAMKRIRAASLQPGFLLTEASVHPAVDHALG